VADPPDGSNMAPVIEAFYAETGAASATLYPSS
jgi:hypothetical protein